MLKKFIVIFVIVFQLIGSAAWAQTSTSTIEQEVQAKNERLKQLNNEIQNTQNTLKEVQKQKTSLQVELKTLDTSIKQLDYRIQADAVAGEKLGLELVLLNGDLEEIAGAIDDRRKTVAELFRALQKSDDTSPFLALLANRNMSELISEVQRIESLRSKLSIDITRLNDLSNEQRNKLGLVSTKKEEVILRQENLKYRKEIIEEQKEKRATILEETKSQENVYQDKMAALKAEQDKMEDEIERLEAQLKKDFNTDVLPSNPKGFLSWPVESPRVTQRFGVLSYLYRGKAHNGLDIGTPVGDAVFAAADGIIMAVDNNDRSRTQKYQYGKHILIKHSNNLATLYAHLSQQLVSPGQTVKRGQLIGYTGNTGYATGPHLHFGLYWAPSITLKAIPPAAGLVPVGVVLNPEDYL